LKQAHQDLTNDHSPATALHWGFVQRESPRDTIPGMSTPDHNTKLESSRFFQRLKAADASDKSSLETTVRMVLDNVASVTTTVRNHFHAYTLHDMTHLWNVVDIMEELIPEHVWDAPRSRPGRPTCSRGRPRTND